VIKIQIEGIIPPVVTLFNKDQEIDHDLMTSFIEHLISKGISSIMILGSTSEFAYLTYKEKCELIKKIGHFLKEKYKKIHYMVGISATNTKESIALGKIAQDNGADTVIATLPTYFPLEKDQIIRYYTELSENLRVPLIAYNFPLTTGVDLTPKILLEMAESEIIIGVKETGIPLEIMKELIESAPSSFSVILGTDLMLKSSLDLGIKAAILSSANFVPEHLVQFFQAYREKNEDKKIELWKYLSKRMSILTYGLNLLPSIVKESIIASGYPITPYIRSPLPSVSEKLKKKIKKLFS